MDDKNKYISPFSIRYASKEMQFLFSPNNKYSTWRKLWVTLAESEMELGLKEGSKPVIEKDMIDEMKEHINDIDYDIVSEYENKFHHDVMSHIYEFGLKCPKAKGIIHLGATSAYVTDNTDIIIMRDALKVLKKKLVNLISILSKFACEYKALPTLSYTHFQPAQPSTVGKRATLWIQDFLVDLKDLDYICSSLKLLGSKGTTGTQASFKELFGDDYLPVKLDKLIAEKMGFSDTYTVSGQTYSRKVDSRVYNILSAIASSAAKMSNDIRLLQHLREIEEPFTKHQIGSSAMPYKRNPILSERIDSLARFVISSATSANFTHASQWLERTLDDSANRRIVISEGFLAVDAILDLEIYISSGLVVNKKIIEKHLKDELPFMITENILMDNVKNGKDRQNVHEEIRKLSLETLKRVKEDGLDNDLFLKISSIKELGIDKAKMDEYLKPDKYIGISIQQVDFFLNNDVKSILEENKELLGIEIPIAK
ncbi:adenylosuccinate lyase [bacterium]|nr:adenylosuccinate lyase [bacterium]